MQDRFIGRTCRTIWNSGWFLDLQLFLSMCCSGFIVIWASKVLMKFYFCFCRLHCCLVSFGCCRPCLWSSYHCNNAQIMLWRLLSLLKTSLTLPIVYSLFRIWFHLLYWGSSEISILLQVLFLHIVHTCLHTVSTKSHTF